MTFSHHYKPCTFSAGWLIEISKSKSAYEQIKLIPSLSKEKEWIKEIKTYKIKLKIQRFGKIYVILKAIYLINKF